ncbi:MAG: hypothetical protein ACRD35_01935, partial [Candidatus Acidiferrales bacterium]
MSDRNKLVLLVVLVAVFVGVNVFRPSSPSPRAATPGRTPPTRAAGGSASPEIPDADLQVERLQPGNGVGADEIKRNIFEYFSRPVKPTPKVETSVAQPPPPPPPPPKPPFRFYGFAQGSS